MSRLGLAPLAGLLLLFGCNQVKTDQYFIVYEPDIDTAAMYRVRVELDSYGAVKYKLSDGYVPASVIDALQGEFKEPADLYQPVSDAQKRSEVLSKILDKRDNYLLELADQRGNIDPAAVEQVPLRYGKLAAAASMSANDLVSVGQNGSAEPYRYRKLVFIASTEVVPIGSLGEQMDAVDRDTSAAIRLITAPQQKKAGDVEEGLGKAGTCHDAVGAFVQRLQDAKWTGQDYLEFFATVRGTKP